MPPLRPACPFCAMPALAACLRASHCGRRKACACMPGLANVLLSIPPAVLHHLHPFPFAALLLPTCTAWATSGSAKLPQLSTKPLKVPCRRRGTRRQIAAHIAGVYLWQCRRGCVMGAGLVKLPWRTRCGKHIFWFCIPSCRYRRGQGHLQLPRLYTPQGTAPTHLAESPNLNLLRASVTLTHLPHRGRHRAIPGPSHDATLAHASYHGKNNKNARAHAAAPALNHANPLRSQVAPLRQGMLAQRERDGPHRDPCASRAPAEASPNRTQQAPKVKLTHAPPPAPSPPPCSSPNTSLVGTVPQPPMQPNPRTSTEMTNGSPNSTPA